MDIGKVLGKNLANLIEKRGYASVEKFAYENGLSKSALSKVLRGTRLPRVDTLVRIAQALDVSLNDLVPLPVRGRAEVSKRKL